MPNSLYKYIIQKSGRAQIIAALFTLALVPLATVPLELQRRMLNDAVEGGNLSLLIQLGALYLGAILLSDSLKYAMNRVRGRISAQVTHALRHSVYYCVYTVVKPESWKHNAHHSVDEGTVVSMLSSEVEKLGGFAGQAISQPLLQIGTALFVVGYMLFIEPLVAGVALALYAPQLFIVPWIQGKINVLALSRAVYVRKLGAFVVEIAEEDAIGNDVPEQFLDITNDIFAVRLRIEKLKWLMKAINNFLMKLGPFGIITFGGWMVMQGNLEVGVIVAFISGFERLGGPMRDTIAFYRQVSDAHMKYALLVNSFSGHEPGTPHGPLSGTEPVPA
ncbi:MAG: ABC transporter ATP-binding protein [Alphaproteobacteria bacterium]|nr:ABC transporter ATP-binding protein [Alphaproteobacteria bacterium]